MGMTRFLPLDSLSLLSSLGEPREALLREGDRAFDAMACGCVAPFTGWVRRAVVPARPVRERDALADDVDAIADQLDDPRLRRSARPTRPQGLRPIRPAALLEGRADLGVGGSAGV